MTCRARVTITRSPSRGVFLAVLAIFGAVAAPGFGCTRDKNVSPARTTYNQALVDLENGRFDDAVEGFSQASSNAGLDTELRFRATVNRGLALARGVDLYSDPSTIPSKDLESTRDRLSAAAAAFQKASSMRPDDMEVRANLELINRHIAAIADQINKGKNSLEARLTRAIDEQRDLRDQIRALTNTVGRSGSAAEPVEFQAEFDALAATQRTLAADVNVVSDLASEELSHLRDQGGQDGEALNDEQKMRMVQLENLEHYLQNARVELADTRRTLRRLQAEKAHRRSDSGLRALVRAHEQLLDPITVLSSVAGDQERLLMHTNILVAIDSGTLRIQGMSEDQPAPTMQAPPWLTDEYLGDGQDGALQRTREVLARFEMASTNDRASQTPDDSSDNSSGAGPSDPKQARMLESAREAVPFLQQATAAMEASRTALAAGERNTSVDKQREALLALAQAIERFAEVRKLIELIYGDHMQTIALLTPPRPEDKTADTAMDPMAAKLASMSTQERMRLITEALTKNLERLTRLQGLFEDELAALDAQAQQANQAAQNPNQADPHAGGDPQQLESAKQQYTLASELRQQAFDALTQLSQEVAELHATGTPDPAKIAQALATADQGKAHIEELRRLFYSLIEHLKELIDDQTKTFDGTGSAASELEPDVIVQKLGPLVDAQREHAAKGQPLTDAVAEQADAATQSAQEDAEAAKRLEDAVQELRAASEEMNVASARIQQDFDDAQASSPDLSDVMAAQRVAIDHLEAALELLQPPQDGQNQQQEQQQEQQEPQQDPQEQQQAERKLQEIRDREAERRRDKRSIKPEPVDKDW